MITSDTGLKTAKKKLKELHIRKQKLQQKMDKGGVPANLQDDLTSELDTAIDALDEDISDYNTLKAWKSIRQAELPLAKMGLVLYKGVHHRKVLNKWKHEDICKRLDITSGRLSQDITARFGNIIFKRALEVFKVLEFSPFFICETIGESELPTAFTNEQPLEELGRFLAMLRVGCDMTRSQLAAGIEKGQSWISGNEKNHYLNCQLINLVKVADFFMENLSFRIILFAKDDRSDQVKKRETDPEQGIAAWGTFNEKPESD